MTLAEFRKTRGVSQYWLAEHMSLTPVTISRYENGITNPPPSFYYQLAYIFRYKPEELQIDGFVI
jgi:transcriptional regulator with XRE-family HTH domain